MEEYKQGLQQRLADHEQELRTKKSNSTPSGGSREYLLMLSQHSSWCIRLTLLCPKNIFLPTCPLMVPGFRVAAAAVEAEADLRELTIDDWDSALEEAGDTLVVVDFFTNWSVKLRLVCLNIQLMYASCTACRTQVRMQPCNVPSVQSSG